MAAGGGAVLFLMMPLGLVMLAGVLLFVGGQWKALGVMMLLSLFLMGPMLLVAVRSSPVPAPAARAEAAAPAPVPR